MQTIKNRNGGWQFALFLGITTKLYYDIAQLQLYHFYLYFYVASFVCYLYSFTLWGAINKEALSLRYGFFNRRTFKVKWNDIQSIRIEKILIKERDAGHGRFNISYHQEVEYLALIIRMHMSLSSEILKVIKKTQGYSYFTNRIEKAKDDHSVMVLTEPKEGFNSIVDMTKRFVKSEVLCEIDNSSRLWTIFKMLMNLIIFSLSIFSFFWVV